ncbi:MAG: hypothetical protein E7255_03610 [Lachnospiraceae bacterium]|jgi:hypothetical protein|nr:hypothetical protein [Lachnospiraceae bacterium]
MGWKLEKIDLGGCDRIKPNEEIDLCVVLEEEKRAAIHGEVKFPNGKPVEGAVVKLFKKKESKGCYDNNCDLEPITFTFTDKCGQFLFGVESEKDYVIKVFYYKPEKKRECKEKEEEEKC